MQVRNNSGNGVQEMWKIGFDWWIFYTKCGFTWQIKPLQMTVVNVSEWTYLWGDEFPRLLIHPKVAVAGGNSRTCLEVFGASASLRLSIKQVAWRRKLLPFVKPLPSVPSLTGWQCIFCLYWATKAEIKKTNHSDWTQIWLETLKRWMRI